MGRRVNPLARTQVPNLHGFSGHLRCKPCVPRRSGGCRMSIEPVRSSRRTATDDRHGRQRMRRFFAALAAASALMLTACAPVADPAPSQGDLPADAPVVAFYGDSYTLGTG